MFTRKDYSYLGALVAICVVVFFIGLDVQDIWDIDEGMHSAMAKTMVLSGDWITPTFNAKAFLDKPVLVTWSNALAFTLFGITEFTARLSSALSGLGCVMITYLLGRRIYDAKTGFLAGIILATSLEMIILSRQVQYDMHFAFFISLALYYFICAVLTEPGKKIYLWSFYVAIALGILTKGPLTLVLVGLVIFVYLLISGRIKFLLEMRMPTGILIVGSIVTPWMLLMERANPGYLEYFIIRQHFANFLDGYGEFAAWHPEPFYFYIPVLVLGFLPWSLTLPQALFHGIRNFRSGSHATTAFLVIWVLAIFLFFSAASSKLATYLMPIFPAAAVLLGRYWQQYLERPYNRSRRGIMVGSGGVFCLLIILTVYIVVDNPWSYLTYRGGIHWGKMKGLLVLASLLFGFSLLLSWRRQHRANFVSFAATSPLILLYILFIIVPDINAYKGSRQISLEYDKLLKPGEKFYFHGQLLDSAIFYAHRDAIMLRTEQELNAHLDSRDRVFALVRSRARSEVNAFKGDYHVIKTIGNKAIVSNQPNP